MFIIIGPEILNITWKQILNNILASILITVVIIPHSIGFSSMTSFDKEHALYSTMIPPIIFAFFSNTQ